MQDSCRNDDKKREAMLSLGSSKSYQVMDQVQGSTCQRQARSADYPQPPDDRLFRLDDPDVDADISKNPMLERSVSQHALVPLDDSTEGVLRWRSNRQGIGRSGSISTGEVFSRANGLQVRASFEGISSTEHDLLVMEFEVPDTPTTLGCALYHDDTAQGWLCNSMRHQHQQQPCASALEIRLSYE